MLIKISDEFTDQFGVLEVYHTYIAKIVDVKYEDQYLYTGKKNSAELYINIFLRILYKGKIYKFLQAFNEIKKEWKEAKEFMGYIDSNNIKKLLERVDEWTLHIDHAGPFSIEGNPFEDNECTFFIRKI